MAGHRLDQRGHGYSDHASSYTRDDYLGDLAALYDHFGIRRAILLGNSLGGVNAYQFATRYPDRVQALVIEDIGVVVKDETSFVLNWTGTFETREQLEGVVGPRFLPYLKDSFRQGPDRWRLAFDPKEMLESQRCLLGDHLKDWLGSSCACTIDSRRRKSGNVASTFGRKGGAEVEYIFRQLPGGHVVHFDSPEAFMHTMRNFLIERAGSE